MTRKTKLFIFLISFYLINYAFYAKINANNPQTYSQKALTEFKEHTKKYYIKVFPTCENFFSKMNPNDLAKAFKKLVNTISYCPWFYLEQQFPMIIKQLNKEEKEEWEKNKFKEKSLIRILKRTKNIDPTEIKNIKKWLNNAGGYWEFIIDQLKFYNKFLNITLVDVDTNTIFFRKNIFDYQYSQDNFSLNYQQRNCKAERLLTFWTKQGETIQFDFYALYFDYSVKLFLEGILKKDAIQSTRYLNNLKEISKKLSGSIYESEITGNLKKYNELNTILKQEKNIDTLAKHENDKELQELLEYLELDDEF